VPATIQEHEVRLGPGAQSLAVFEVH